MAGVRRLRIGEPRIQNHYRFPLRRNRRSIASGSTARSKGNAVRWRPASPVPAPNDSRQLSAPRSIVKLVYSKTERPADSSSESPFPNDLPPHDLSRADSLRRSPRSVPERLLRQIPQAHLLPPVR